MRPISAKRVVTGCIGGTVLLACGVYIWRSFQWREVFELLSQTDLAWFFLGGGATIIAYWLVRAWRWRLLLGSRQSGIGFAVLYLCSSVALSLSIFTPFQSGEAFKVELLRKYGHVARLQGYSAFLLERVADLYAVIALGIFALAFRLGSLSYMEVVLVAAIFVAVPVLGYVLLHRLRLDGWIGDVVGELQGGISNPGALLLMLCLTFLSWAIIALGWHACLYSLSIDLPFVRVLGLVSVITLLTVLSLIPGGIGVSEAGIVELLMGMDISPTKAQAGALVVRCYGVFAVALGFGHLVFWKFRDALPRRIRRSNSA